MKPIAALLFILASAPIAHADNTTDQSICQQSTDFGLSPGQIADNLHNGQPSMPEWRQRGDVLNTLGGCDQP